MQKMKAAVFEEFGGSEKIEIAEVKVPELKEGEVLVKIYAAGVNPVDAVIVEGHYKNMMPHDFPVIPGWDMAGVVEARGHGSRRFEVGDEVYAYARRPRIKWGTFAEYIVIPDSYLSRKPASLSWEEAAGVPLAGLTAYQTVYGAGNLQRGQKILILGASGGVGSFAIQLAKERGAEITGVASAKNHQYMRDLGADHCIDYTKTNIGEAARKIHRDGVDVILDCTSGESLKQALKALKPTGKLVSILNKGEDLDSNIDFNFVFVEPDVYQLDDLSRLADQDKLQVELSKTYPLEESRAALEQIHTLHTTGKIVIKT